MRARKDMSDLRRARSLTLSEREWEAFCVSASRRGMKPSVYLRWLHERDAVGVDVPVESPRPAESPVARSAGETIEERRRRVLKAGNRSEEGEG